MEETESLLVNDPQFVTDDYNRIYAVYASMGYGLSGSQESEPVDDLASFLSLLNDSAKVALYSAWAVFNIQGKQRQTSGMYGITNYFEDDTERKTRELLIESINKYIRHLEPIRYSYNKIASLYTLLITKGLYGLLGDLYIPADMRETVDYIIKTVNDDLDGALKAVRDHFAEKNNPKLNEIVKSLGSIILSQRSDQVISNLKNYEPNLDYYDLEFLQSQRDIFLDHQKGAKQQMVLEAFELPKTTYQRNRDKIVSDLAELLDEDTIELLTNLFIRN